MKKVIAVLLTLIMAFALCVPSFAESEMDSIANAVADIVNYAADADNADDTQPEATEPDLSNITEETAADLVKALLDAGATKEEVKEKFDGYLADEKITKEQYDILIAALEAAKVEDPTDEPTTEVPDSQVPEVAQRIIDTLKKMGVTAGQLQGVVDQLFEAKIIPQNVYDEITKMINAQEETTAADNQAGGGISGFFGGIINTIKGLFGMGGDDTQDPGNSNNNTNPGDYAGKEPTGDTAIFSIAAVAAVAGVALVLTKKKEK